MNYFAKNLKRLRLEQGKSMQALADEAKVSKSMICKIERDEVQPTIDVACRLGKALNKPLSEMLHPTQNANVIFLSKETQAVWKDAKKITRRNISPVMEGMSVEWLHVVLPSKVKIDKSQLYAYGGEKYFLVTKGVLDINLDQQTFKLKKGDSLYLDAFSPHDCENTGRESVEFYVVKCKPQQ